MTIENTSARDPFIHLLGAMSDGTSGYIEGMEAAGQRQLVNSDRLPTRINTYDRSQAEALVEFEALGFTFGDPDPNDPMFRPATLPDGWKREGSDHAMWSYIVDQHGRRRVSIFYKAAFYDRDAFMSLNTPLGYLREVLYDNRQPVLDDVWLTAEVADRELAAIRDRELEESKDADAYAGRADLDDTYWAKRAAEHRADADKAEKLRLRIAELAVS